MAPYYYNPQQQQHHNPSSTSSHSSSSSHNHHGGRSRKAPRMSAAHHPHKQFRRFPSPRDIIESPVIVAATRARFEAGRSFDLDDDLEFCPGLLTEDDMQSIHSSSTDGSLASSSPQSSPLQPQSQPTQQVTPNFSLNSASSSNFIPANGFQSSNHHHQQQQMKIHQPAAVRTRNAIPIVNPNTGMQLPSPPSSVSPAMMQQHQQAYRRW